MSIVIEKEWIAIQKNSGWKNPGFDGIVFFRESTSGEVQKFYFADGGVFSIVGISPAVKIAEAANYDEFVRYMLDNMPED